MDTTYSGRPSRIVAMAAVAVFAASVITACASSRPAAEPDTAAAARAAARQVIGDFEARRPGKVWDRLTAAAQQAVDRGTWTAVYDGCRHAPFRWQAGAATVTPDGKTAQVVVTVAGYPLLVTFEYDGQQQRWRYQPASLSMFAAGSAAADITAANAAEVCS